MNRPVWRIRLRRVGKAAVCYGENVAVMIFNADDLEGAPPVDWQTTKRCLKNVSRSFPGPKESDSYFPGLRSFIEIDLLKTDVGYILLGENIGEIVFGHTGRFLYVHILPRCTAD